MLVLNRKVGESLMIGDQISITVLSVEAGGQVNLGICAPKEVLILRSELQKAVTANQDAADTASATLVAELEAALRGCDKNRRQPPEEKQTPAP